MYDDKKHVVAHVAPQSFDSRELDEILKYEAKCKAEENMANKKIIEFKKEWDITQSKSKKQFIISIIISFATLIVAIASMIVSIISLCK